SSASPGEAAGRSLSGDVDTGFLQIYGPENQLDAEQQEHEATLESRRRLSHPQQQELLQSFAETYWEHCYAWCPVLDRETLAADLGRSPLLANALALAASHIRPPLVPHEGPATYYERARRMFYDDEEAGGLAMLQALALFYWWAPRPPSTVHRHSSWWWTSVIIRHAQQMNFHREPGGGHPLAGRLDMSLRRRIWWTAFVGSPLTPPCPARPQGPEQATVTNTPQARERLTALCQSKPCIIDPDDCNLQESQLSDFPPDPASQRKGLVFINWVRLCGIMGRIAKRLSRSASSAAQPFTVDLEQELADWAHSLPPELQLPIGSARTDAFDRDVHQLHLPYLTTIIILHLKRSAHHLPQALPPAVLAASCTARILRDVLSRGDARFLMPITCWYSGTAFVPLLQACRVDRFAAEAAEGLDVLARAVDELQTMWGSARVISQGFERLRGSVEAPLARPDAPQVRAQSRCVDGEFAGQPDADMQTLGIPGGLDWEVLFPFVTRSTSKIAEGLLVDKEQGAGTGGFPFPEDVLFHETLWSQYHDLLEPSGFLDFPEINFEA
ncbi:MAG: fungal specific transcription factor domain-containing protein, partial [Acidobacteria bacterium]|nr:fungal specific transcription factor domain-containing protein [Acidobacteriota bacterium]